MGSFRDKKSAVNIAGLVLLAALLAPAAAGAGIVSPRDGKGLPRSFLEMRKESKEAFTLSRRWYLGRRAAALEAAAMLYAGGEGPLKAPAITGTIRIPVLCGVYSDFEGTPESTAELQQMLFDGPWPTGTMTDYWDEVSFGNLDVTGDVHGWVDLTYAEDYYTGGMFVGMTPGYSHTDEMIAEVVGGLDGSIDFGQYDNDGPDGIPNSGDDDGYVDILVVVHPTVGAECSGWHIWSHSWRYSYWDQFYEPLFEPLETGDAAAGGGVILIDDYIVAPALSCDEGMIEIGVFCHEFGHALGLPDLYDFNGGAYGIGHWGLMGAGNWNTVESPAHLCAWSREQLGWADVMDIGWEETGLDLEPVGQSGQVARLALPTRRFRRMPNVAPVTGYSLICGYTAAEAEARGWRGEAGYGNEWHESIVREFQSDGTMPCVLQYSIGCDIEGGYDFVRLLMEIGSHTDTLAVYTGIVDPFVETVDLSSYLPAGPCDFTLRFEFTSDLSYSDEDNLYDSVEGWSLNIDNMSVNGAGIGYYCDFETDAGGWHQAGEPAEYFIVENRQRTGFDSNLPGTGLLIMHAENSIIYGNVGNSGGITNEQARGVVVEEADGDFDLLNPPPDNFGDSGDPWPGSTGNSTFNSTSAPSSRSNGGSVTPVSITGIGTGSVVFKAGMPAPQFVSVDPDYITAAVVGEFTLDIRGENIQYGASCRLSKDGMFGGIEAVEVEWLGENRMLATFETAGLYGGLWHVIVTGGDGQVAVGVDALAVDAPFLSAEVTVGRDNLTVDWEMAQTGLRGCLLYRSESGGAFVQITPDTLRSGDGTFSYEDYAVVPEVEYRYMIRAWYNSSEEELTIPGTYSIDEVGFTVDAVYPNPFQDVISIDLFAPAPMNLSLYLYDVAGRKAASLRGVAFLRGEHTLEWDLTPEELRQGVYFFVLRTAGFERSYKLVLLR